MNGNEIKELQLIQVYSPLFIAVDIIVVLVEDRPRGLFKEIFFFLWQPLLDSRLHNEEVWIFTGLTVGVQQLLQSQDAPAN